jgi:hypothetical protein
VRGLATPAPPPLPASPAHSARAVTPPPPWWGPPVSPPPKLPPSLSPLPLSARTFFLPRVARSSSSSTSSPTVIAPSTPSSPPRGEPLSLRSLAPSSSLLPRSRPPCLGHGTCSPRATCPGLSAPRRGTPDPSHPVRFPAPACSPTPTRSPAPARGPAPARSPRPAPARQPCLGAMAPARSPGAAQRPRSARPYPRRPPLPARSARVCGGAARSRRVSAALRASALVVRLVSWRGSLCSRRDA